MSLSFAAPMGAASEESPEDIPAVTPLNLSPTAASVGESEESLDAIPEVAL